MTLYPSVICCFRELHAFQMNIMKISFRKSFIQYIYVRGGQGVVIEIWRATFVRQMIFGLSARRVPEKIYLYPVDKNRQTTSRLWIQTISYRQAIEIYF